MLECFVIILLSLSMFVGCYLAGLIPLSVSLSEEKLNMVSILGAGLLVGTALAVIIPEGVNTLYKNEMAHQHQHDHMSSTKEANGNTIKDAKEAVSHDHGPEMHSLIGVALVLGFLFMLIIDNIGAGHHHHKAPGTDLEGPIKIDKADKLKITATLGLVVHAAADGVALGAAASTEHAEIEMIVFVAIMLHKAPAAFALVTFLMHEGFDRPRIRKHLLVFSLAAPATALSTYYFLSQTLKESESTVSTTGLALLFSAGTFLYVATVHVLPELVMQHHAHADMVEGTGLTKRELFVLVLGTLLPVMLSFGHHH